MDANWAVGSIFGVWAGGHLVGRSGRDLKAAAYAVYGPATVLVIACPAKGACRVSWSMGGEGRTSPIDRGYLRGC